jgi:hypothetical protein
MINKGEEGNSIKSIACFRERLKKALQAVGWSNLNKVYLIYDSK